jgi:hypothetical protein
MLAKVFEGARSLFARSFTSRIAALAAPFPSSRHRGTSRPACGGLQMLRRYSRAFSRTTGRVRWSRFPDGVPLRCARLGLSASRTHYLWRTRCPHRCRTVRWKSRRPASQYLEGEIEAVEFRDKLLNAIAYADQGALIAFANAIADPRRGDGLAPGPS